MYLASDCGQAYGVVGMKSVEEVADNLWEDCKGASKADALPFIAQALAAYANGQVQEASESYFRQGYKEGIEANSQLILKACAEALEEAAKVAERHRCHSKNGQPVVIHKHPDVDFCQEEIAESIRALKSKV